MHGENNIKFVLPVLKTFNEPGILPVNMRRGWKWHRRIFVYSKSFTRAIKNVYGFIPLSYRYNIAVVFRHRGSFTYMRHI
jgi:hypothetical protein